MRVALKIGKPSSRELARPEKAGVLRDGHIEEDKARSYWGSSECVIVLVHLAGRCEGTDGLSQWLKGQAVPSLTPFTSLLSAFRTHSLKCHFTYDKTMYVLSLEEAAV